MSDISESYQQDKKQEQPAAVPYSFATVVAVHPDGLQLVFPGETGAGEKHYKCNTTARFEPGQRVYLAKDSGSYVVLFPIGAPGSGGAPSAGRAETANSATSAESAGTAKSADVASSIKNTGTNYAPVELRARYTNELEYRIKGGEWIKLQNRGG